MRLVHFAVPMTALATLSACQMGQARDAGPQTTRSFPAGNATRLAVAGSYDVTVSTGSAPGVQATGGQNRLDDIVVEQDGDTLKIHPKPSNGMNWTRWTNDKGVKISVTLPTLASVAMAGSGDVTVNKVAGDSFEANLAGSGGLKLDSVQARQLAIKIAGSGDVSAKGTVGATQMSVAGSGDVDAADLVADTAEIKVMGSGNVRLQAKQSANVSVAGSGDVEIKGGAKCQISKAGSGEVRCS
ncbi:MULTISPECIES: head GIN domain-containing protein [Sphingomonas]|uniref:head GIN domain-containing protein n=1 Tax=Sphingomonas TaxID=13687 RepID=UPI0013B36B88|nr:MULTISPECIES: head GIN domain-containing protein [Sphingomonas]